MPVSAADNSLVGKMLFFLEREALHGALSYLL
jgi:hypothetical protein